ncbi:ELWxxDGT repeat protein [Archangium gephyra]|uniref:ELWxxDGT repeat protein n=1 Tax=Archangium gephyra TaxID=48 RepID=UPI003B7F3EDE
MWRTDGTPEGTKLVRDISLGTGGSEPQSFTELGGRLYFLVNAPGGTRQLWRTDGTPEGTTRVGASVTVTAVSAARGLVRSGRALYFAGNEGTAGTELWKTDGTEAGTVRVKDILPGATGSSPVQLTAFEGAVYFVATDGVTGRELWKTDGTEAGTQRVLELVSGNNSVEKPDSLVATSTRLFFMMRDTGNVESALYATDGTAAGTSKLVDFKAASGKGPLLMTAHGSTLYFTGYEPGVGHELWTSDGTPAGSRRIGTNHFSGDRLADPAPKAFTVMGDTVYFVATAPGTGLSDENPPLPTLWKTRGDAATTVPVGTELTSTRGSNPAPFASWEGGLYFTTFEQESAARLWRTDGTATGTLPLVNIVPKDTFELAPETGLSALTPFNGALYFAALPSLAEGFELWKTDGSPTGTTRVTPSVKLTTAASSPIEIISHGGLLFFAGQDATSDIELWKSDGTEAGTTLVKDIAVGSGPSSRPSRFTPMGDALYFIARDASGGRELWRTEGSEANTSRVAEIRDWLGMGSVLNIAGVVGSTLYFVADEENTGIELWKTDGTAANTSLVKDIAPGILDAGPSAFAVIDGVLYFTASDGFGPELWKTDGTESGTVLVQELLHGGRGLQARRAHGARTDALFHRRRRHLRPRAVEARHHRDGARPRSRQGHLPGRGQRRARRVALRTPRRKAAPLRRQRRRGRHRAVALGRHRGGHLRAARHRPLAAWLESRGLHPLRRRPRLQREQRAERARAVADAALTAHQQHAPERHLPGGPARRGPAVPGRAGRL